MSVLDSGNHPEAAIALNRAKQWIIMKWGLLDWAHWVLKQVDGGNPMPPLTWNSVDTNGLSVNGMNITVAPDSPAAKSVIASSGPSDNAGADVTELTRAVHGIRVMQTQQALLLRDLTKQVERLNSEVMKKSDVNLFMPVDSEA